MISPQLFMGSAVALLCGVAFPYDRWFLTETTKGRRLVRWLGEPRAILVWRIALMIGIAFGIALACGVVNPLSWGET